MLDCGFTTFWSTAEEILGADSTTEPPGIFLHPLNDSLSMEKNSQFRDGNFGDVTLLMIYLLVSCRATRNISFSHLFKTIMVFVAEMNISSK